MTRYQATINEYEVGTDEPVYVVYDSVSEKFAKTAGRLFATKNESAARSLADRLNRGTYHHGMTF